MRLVTHSIAVLLEVFFVVSAAHAETPRVVARDELTEVTGLPAISADGSVVVLMVPFDTSSEADLVRAEFIRVSDGASVDSWLVLERNDMGSLLAPPTDGRGTTPWRRARNLTLELAAAGYRSMSSVGETEMIDRSGPIRGAGIRITQRRRAVTVSAIADGHARWAGDLPAMDAFCGMSDEHPRAISPHVHNAWLDRTSNVAVLQYGHVYASCMCPSDLAFLPVTLSP